MDSISLTIIINRGAVISSDFTFVCPTEIVAYNDALPQFDELDVEVLGMRMHASLSPRRYCTHQRP